MARLGLATRAATYALLAYIAAEIALTDASPAQASGSGALTEVRKQSAGRTLLGLLAVGLLGYALWRVALALSREKQGVGDRQESVATGAFKRAGFVASAMVYFFLCGQAPPLPSPLLALILAAALRPTLSPLLPPCSDGRSARFGSAWLGAGWP